MERNPFEAPRSSLDGAVLPAAGAPGEVSAEVVDHVVRGGAWAGRASLLAFASVGLGVVNAVFVAAMPLRPGELAGAIGGLVVGTPIGVIFALLLRTIARRSAALGRREAGSADGVLDAHRSLFKMTGVLTIAMLALGAIGMAVGIVAAVLAAKGGA